MRTLFALIFAFLLMISCNSRSSDTTNDMTEEPETVKEHNGLEGAWELVGFYNYKDNVVTDSFNTAEGYRQVKIYTSTKVMWSKDVPTDSTEWFGYGTYKLEDNTLTEVLDYGSEMMSKIIQERKEFIYEINLSKDSFSQIEIDEDGNRIYSENYKRIE